MPIAKTLERAELGRKKAKNPVIRRALLAAGITVLVSGYLIAGKSDAPAAEKGYVVPDSVISLERNEMQKVQKLFHKNLAGQANMIKAAFSGRITDIVVDLGVDGNGYVTSEKFTPVSGQIMWEPKGNFLEICSAKKIHIPDAKGRHVGAPEGRPYTLRFTVAVP